MYARFEKLVWHLVRKLRLPPGVDAEDIVQSTWVKLLESPFDENDPNATTYIAKTVRSVLADAVKDVPKTADLSAEPAEEKTLFDNDRLISALAILTPADRLLLTRRYLDGFSLKRLAAVSRTTVERVRARIRRARKRARIAYDKDQQTRDPGN